MPSRLSQNLSHRGHSWEGPRARQPTLGVTERDTEAQGGGQPQVTSQSACCLCRESSLGLSALPTALSMPGGTGPASPCLAWRGSRGQGFGPGGWTRPPPPNPVAASQASECPQARGDGGEWGHLREAHEDSSQEPGGSRACQETARCGRGEGSAGCTSLEASPEGPGISLDSQRWIRPSPCPQRTPSAVGDR